MLLPKSKLLSIVIIVLVLINTLALSYIFFSSKYHSEPFQHKAHFAVDIISEKLNFNDKQRATFEILRKDHSSKNKKYKEAIKYKREMLIQSVISHNDSLAKKIAIEIGSIQEKIELNNYEHFEQIKLLCNTEQLEQFEEVIMEIQQHINRSDRPPHHHPPPPSRN